MPLGEHVTTKNHDIHSMRVEEAVKKVIIDNYFLRENKISLFESKPCRNNEQTTGSSRSIYPLPEDSSRSVTLLKSQYQCDRCKTNFENLSSLQRHKNSWHQITQLSCRLCLIEFTDKRKGHMHIRVLHNLELMKVYLDFDKGLLPSMPSNLLRERIINHFHKRRPRHVRKMSNAAYSYIRPIRLHFPCNSVALPSDASPTHLAYNEAVSVSDLLSTRLTGLRVDTPEHASNSTGATTTPYNANAAATSATTTAYNTNAAATSANAAAISATTGATSPNAAATSANAAATNANTAAMSDSDVLSVNLTSLHINAPVTSHTSNSEVANH